MQGAVTKLLRRLQEGDKDAESQLITTVYSELKRLARSHMRGLRQDQTLQPTALVHEAYIKLTGASRIDWTDRHHFFCLASQAMRQVLVDYARKRLSQKRGGQARVLLLDETLVANKGTATEILEVNDALERLSEFEPRVFQVINLRFFGGLSVDETAKVLGISARTVKREWRVGRAWLRGELEPEGASRAATVGLR
jgi:RNA polymerase sigma factor (TIGR02999 family)